MRDRPSSRAFVSDGAGFIGSCHCARVVNDSHSVICGDYFLRGTKDAIPNVLDSRHFGPTRYDEPFPSLCGGERDLQRGRARPNDPLPVRPAAGYPDRRAWRDLHRGLAKRSKGAHV